MQRVLRQQYLAITESLYKLQKKGFVKKMSGAISADRRCLVWSSCVNCSERLSLPCLLLLSLSYSRVFFLSFRSFAYDPALREAVVKLSLFFSIRLLSFSLMYLSPVSSNRLETPSSPIFVFFFSCCPFALKVPSFRLLIIIYEQVYKEMVIGKYRSLQCFTFESWTILVPSQTRCFAFYGGNLETGSLHLIWLV